ncbi:MAG: hypothetical protein ACE149_00435 [Armatimonadota bacterium]
MGGGREPRSRVTDEGGVLEITIPMPRRWHHHAAAAVAALVIVAWGVGLPAVVVGSCLGWPAVSPGPRQADMAKPDTVILVGMATIMWLGGMAMWLFPLLWWCCGLEVVLIDADTLTLRREMPSYASTERFELEGVRQFRAVDRGAGYYFSFYPWASDIIYHPWHLAFNYRGDVIRFAGALDGDEAESIVREIAARVPALVEVGEPREGVLAPRPTVTEVTAGLEIVMPVRSPALGMVALLAAAVSYGGWMAVSWGPERFPPLPGGRVAWLAYCLVGSVFAVGLWAYWVLWLLLGREVALLDGTALTLKRVTPLFTRTEVFDLRDVRALRSTPEPWSARTLPSWWTRLSVVDIATRGLAGGFLAFDYQGRTIHFGVGLDQARAQQIVDQITTRFPRLAETGS